MVEKEVPRLALVGHPNVGKSTLFNALTGGKSKIGNYPGVTVERKAGEFFTPHGQKIELLDLPGCLSLASQAKDATVTRDVLLGAQKGERAPDLVVSVIDANAVERHLPLVLQVIELGLPVLVVLNKIDLAESEGVRLNSELLSEDLGLPVLAVQADGKGGLLDLKQALRFPFPLQAERTWKGSKLLEKSLKELAEQLADEGVSEGQAFRLLADAGYRSEEAAGISRQAQTLAREFVVKLSHKDLSPEQELDRLRRERVRAISSGVVTSLEESSNWTDLLDREFLHPWRGWLYLGGIFFLVFWALFQWSGVPMGWVEFIFGVLGEFVSGLIPPGTLQDLLVDGVVAGVGGVVIFLPQILMLFFFLGLLESTGYMARAAVLMDGVMQRVGLSGRSFLPLLSGYACAIPGVMGARSVPGAKERLLTILILPWMSCSARLPVYLLLIPLLVTGGSAQALTLFWLYALGTVTSFVAAYYLRPAVGMDEKHRASFLMELPAYRWPDFGFIGRHLVERALAFLKKAGTVILGISIVLWVLSEFPKAPSGEESEQFSYSAMGQIGKAIEPVIAPLGWDDRLGTAMLASFAAREVFNSQVKISYAIEGEDDADETLETIRGKFAKAYGLPTILSLLVFYVYALQCLPTTAVVGRETKSWKFALAQLGGMSLFAYLAALLARGVAMLFFS